MSGQLKNNCIFAVSHLHKDIVFQIQSLFTYHKGIVPHSFFSNVKSGCCNLRGLYPHFINVNYFLMQHPENNLQHSCQACGAVTSNSRNEETSLTLLYKIFNDFGSKWYVISISKKGCVVKFRASKKLFILAKGKTLHEAMHSLLQKLIDHSLKM